MSRTFSLKRQKKGKRIKQKGLSCNFVAIDEWSQTDPEPSTIDILHSNMSSDKTMNEVIDALKPDDTHSSYIPPKTDEKSTGCPFRKFDGFIIRPTGDGHMYGNASAFINANEEDIKEKKHE